MSMNRRARAMVARERAQEQRQRGRQRLTEVYAGPAGTSAYGGRTALLFDGAETTIRNAAGEVVVATKAPDFVLPPDEYGQLITAAPMPLSKRVRAKRAR